MTKNRKNETRRSFDIVDNPVSVATLTVLVVLATPFAEFHQWMVNRPYRKMDRQKAAAAARSAQNQR